MNSDKLLEQWRSLIQEEARLAAEQVVKHNLIKIEILGQQAKDAVQAANAASERAQSISTIIDRAAQAAHEGFLGAANHAEIGTVTIESDIKSDQNGHTDLFYRVDGRDSRILLHPFDGGFARRGPVSLEAGKYTAVFLLYKQGGK